jgi:hypothetical protein
MLCRSSFPGIFAGKLTRRNIFTPSREPYISLAVPFMVRASLRNARAVTVRPERVERGSSNLKANPVTEAQGGARAHAPSKYIQRVISQHAQLHVTINLCFPGCLSPTPSSAVPLFCCHITTRSHAFVVARASRRRLQAQRDDKNLPAKEAFQRGW